MLTRPLFRQALAQAEQLLHTLRSAAPLPAPLPDAAPSEPSPVLLTARACPNPPVPGPVLPSTPPAAEPAAAPAATPPAEGSTAGVVSWPEEPTDPHHRQGLRHARAHRWHWAQRELEVAVRTAPDSLAHADLECVRTVRRELRRLQKWPRDAQAYVTLGRAYFELELGAEAEQACRQAIALAPQDAAAYYLLALEYAYRGATPDAERVYAQAQALVDGLPPFSSVLTDLGGEAAAAGTSPSRRLSVGH